MAWEITELESATPGQRTLSLKGDDRALLVSALLSTASYQPGDKDPTWDSQVSLSAHDLGHILIVLGAHLTGDHIHLPR